MRDNTQKILEEKYQKEVSGSLIRETFNDLNGANSLKAFIGKYDNATASKAVSYIIEQLTYSIDQANQLASSLKRTDSQDPYAAPRMAETVDQIYYRAKAIMETMHDISGFRAAQQPAQQQAQPAQQPAPQAARPAQPPVQQRA